MSTHSSITVDSDVSDLTARASEKCRPLRMFRFSWLSAIIFVFGNSLRIHFDESQMHAP